MTVPKESHASELWLKLSQRPRPTTRVPFPTRAGAEPLGDLLLWVLTEDELHAVRSNAQRTARAKLLDGAPIGAELNYGYEDIYRNELQVELIALSARDVDNPIFPVFDNAASARKKLTSDEFAILASAYTQWRLECGPILREVSEAELEGWLKVLQAGASRLPLARLSGEALIDLVLFLVSRLQASSSATGSAGSPPDGSSTDPTPSAELDPQTP
jgi:hypothetical protein